MPLSMLDFNKNNKIVVKIGLLQAHLLRPKVLHVYRKKSQSNYNIQKRNCESYYICLLQEFNTDQQRVDFKAIYLIELLKTLQKTFYTNKQQENPLQTLTQIQLKQKMLDALGILAKRKIAAYKAIKKCKQRQSQLLTKLLNYLCPYQEKLGKTNKEQQLLNYTATLLN